MFQSAQEGISIFTFWKDIDYPEDLEIRDYEIHVFHEGAYLIYLRMSLIVWKKSSV